MHHWQGLCFTYIIPHVISKSLYFDKVSEKLKNGLKHCLAQYYRFHWSDISVSASWNITQLSFETSSPPSAKTAFEMHTSFFSKLILYLTLGRHQDRRNPPDLWRNDPDIELRGARRRQYWPNHHHIRQSGLCRACAVPYQHEVSH